jgi:RimJ/RimL family protein N-acetyltransferase
MDHSVFLNHKESRAMLCVPFRRDARLMMQWMNDEDTRSFLMRFAPIMLEGEEKWLLGMAEKSAHMHPISDAVFLLVDKASSKRIGTMGLHKIDWKNRFAVTGTVIGSKQHLSKGLGTDAKMVLLNWAFNELNLNKVESRVLSFNERSAAYAKKCGYKEVGRLRRHIFRKGAYHDEIILEVHNEEWQPLWKKFEEGVFRKKS